MINSHYVPILTLRRFEETIYTYDVRTGRYKENVNIKKAFLKYIDASICIIISENFMMFPISPKRMIVEIINLELIIQNYIR